MGGWRGWVGVGGDRCMERGGQGGQGRGCAPVKTRRESGESATAVTSPPCPRSVRRCCPLAAFQSRADMSAEADASRRPSLQRASAVIRPVWPCMVKRAARFPGCAVTSPPPAQQVAPARQAFWCACHHPLIRVPAATAGGPAHRCPRR